MTEQFKLPFKLVESDNDACGDPGCCGSREEWLEIRDANGRIVFSGCASFSHGGEEQMLEIQKAFESLYKQENPSTTITIGNHSHHLLNNPPCKSPPT